MSGTMVTEGKKMMMSPFVPFERRAYFYSLLAACLEIDVHTTSHPALVRFEMVFSRVATSAAESFEKEQGKPSVMLATLQRCANNESPLNAFRVAFGFLTVSEEVLLKAISSQDSVESMVKGLRSLAILVVSETP